MNVPRVQRQSGVRVRHCLIQDNGVGRAHSIVGERLRFQRQLIGSEAGVAEPATALQFRQFDLRRDAAHDMAGNLFLQRENIFQIAVVFFAPDMRAGIPVEKLRGDPHPVAGAAHAAFEHIANAQFPRHLPDIHRLALVGKGRVARDDEQFVEPRQLGDDVLDDAIDKELLLRVARHVVEGQDGDRGFLR